MLTERIEYNETISRFQPFGQHRRFSATLASDDGHDPVLQFFPVPVFLAHFCGPHSLNRVLTPPSPLVRPKANQNTITSKPTMPNTTALPVISLARQTRHPQ